MAKGKQGFASNPDKINRGGRPKGAKSRNTTKEAIKRLDANKIDAAQVFVDVVSKKDPTEGTELKLSDMMKAAQIILTMPETLRKGIDASKDTDEDDDEETSVKVSEDGEGNKVVALVSMRPKKD